MLCYVYLTKTQKNTNARYSKTRSGRPFRLVYKCLHEAAPSYLTCVFQLLPALAVVVFVKQHVEI